MVDNLTCACGEPARHTHVIARTELGRETVASCCEKCSRISYWYRTSTPTTRIMLIDYKDKPASAKRWPARGWLRKHQGRIIY